MSERTIVNLVIYSSLLWVAFGGLPGVAFANPHRYQSMVGVDLEGKATLAVMERHAKAMETRDVDVIASDYADDAIVIATIYPKIIVGKAELKRAIAECLKIPPVSTPASDTHFTTKEAVGHYGYQIFENRGLMGSETYVVNNGKIVFETATIELKKKRVG